MTEKHTPTPWTMGGYGGYTIYNGAKEIASVTWGKGVDSDASKYNAAHIVKCVNMHDELVEALKAIIHRSNNDPLGTSKVIDMRKIATEALKKAGAL